MLLKKKTDNQSIEIKKVFLEKETFNLLNILSEISEYSLDVQKDRIAVMEQLLNSLLSKGNRVKPKIIKNVTEIKKFFIPIELNEKLKTAMIEKKYDPLNEKDVSSFLNQLLFSNLSKDKDLQNFINKKNEVITN